MNRQLDDATMDHLRHSHEWVRWLSDTDAKVVAMWLCSRIEDTSLEMLRDVVQHWRKRALRALDEDNWTTMVDGYIEVRVDARQYLLTQGKI